MPMCKQTKKCKIPSERMYFPSTNKEVSKSNNNELVNDDNLVYEENLSDI